MEKLEEIIRPTIWNFYPISAKAHSKVENKQQKVSEKLKPIQKILIHLYIAGIIRILTMPSNLQKDQNLKLFSWGKGTDNTLRIISIKKDIGNTTDIRLIRW